MNRRRATKNPPSDSSDDESSSESDIENYLQPADKIDLDSSFFKVDPPFNKIEGEILAGVSTLTDSESDNETTPPKTNEDLPSTSKLNFRQLHEYTQKLEDTKRQVDEYNARKRAKEKEMNVENLLAAGESKLNEVFLEGDLQSSDFESCSESEKEGWEEVEEREKEESVIPKEGLQITVEMTGAVRKKKGVDLMASIKRRINRVRKENQVLVHKVHLLCWVGHGNYISSQINSQNVLGVALSLLPSQQCQPADRTDLKYLEQVLKWYKSAITCVEKPVPFDKSLDELLEAQITQKEAFDKKMLVLIFIAIMRSLGIQCRLVLSLQVEPLRPPSSELHSVSTKNDQKVAKDKGEAEEKESRPESTVAKDEEKKARPKSTMAKDEEKEARPKSTMAKDEEKKARPKSTSGISELKVEESKPRSKSTSEAVKPTKSKNNGKNKSEPKPKTISQDTVQREKNKLVENSKSNTRSQRVNKENPSRTSPRSKSTSDTAKSQIKIKLQPPKSTSKSKPKPEAKTTRKLRNQKVPQLDGANDSPKAAKPNLKRLKTKEPPCPIKAHPKRLKSVPNYRDYDSEDDFMPTRSPFSNKNSPQTKNGPNLKKLKGSDVRNDIINMMKKNVKEKSAKKRKSADNANDSDYAPKNKHQDSGDEFAPTKAKVKRKVQVKKDAQEDVKVKKKQGMDFWAEVYLETEEKWISVDVVKGQINCVNELHTRASNPVSYIVAWNNDNTLKDITARYCANFNTVTRKLRTDPKWWQETLKPFMGHPTARDKDENEEMDRLQLEKPLPTVISEYKNHPLYVLKRHLLKFEAIYPPDAPTLGFVRNEPIYSRACVYTLHSRDIWLKHAKVVKPGEQPYKIVKARPKWDKLSNKVITDQMLEVFGPWQTQDYEPPTAENGVVPRNAFGNVELFMACMLPKKTVHLKLPGLNKIARRMNIDCASALVGFDFHAGWSHPTYDGFVVCEEFADELVVAWEIDQEEQEKREQEKIDKRVYGNWKRLIRGLLIRERLKAKYEFGEPSGGKKKSKGAPKFSTKKKKVESDNDSD